MGRNFSERWSLDYINLTIFLCSYLHKQGEVLKGKAAEGGVEGIRLYLRKRGVDAYRQKQAEIEAVEAGLMPQAERFFVLVQTDNLWKEHLQV